MGSERPKDKPAYILLYGEIRKWDGKYEEEPYGELILHDRCGPCGKCIDRTLHELTALEAALKAALEEVDDWREVDRLQAIENETGEEAVGMPEARDALCKSMARTDRLRKECGL